ncbi:unnamed protein product, partial [Effrenium voratum]
APVASALSTEGVANHPKTRAERLEAQTLRFEREAAEAEEEAAGWERRAQNAATDAGAVTEQVQSALRKRGVLSWVRESGSFKRMLNSRSSAHASHAAAVAKAPYVKADSSWRFSPGADETDFQPATVARTQLPFTNCIAFTAYGLQGPAAAWKAEADATQQAVQRLQGYVDQYRLSGMEQEAATYSKEAEDLAKHAEDATRVAEKYARIAGRITEAIPTIKKMEDMAAAHARWAEQPFPETQPQELVTLTVAPPLAL